MTYTRTRELDPAEEHNSTITCLAFSPKATYLATADASGTVIIWDVHTGDKLTKLGDPELHTQWSTEVSTLLWAPYNSRSLFIGRVKGTGALIVDVLANFEPIMIHTGTRWRIGSMDVDAKTRSVALTVGPDVQLSRPVGHVGDYVPVVLLPPPRPPPDTSIELAVRPKSVQLGRGANVLYATYLEHGIVCWDVAQETPLWQIFAKSPLLLHSSISMDLRSLFVALEDGTAELFRIGEHRPRLNIRYQDDGPSRLPTTTFLSHGSALAVGAQAQPIRIWDTQGELLQEILPGGAQGHSSGLIAARDTKHIDYLGCVVETHSASNAGEASQRIIIYTSPVDHNAWASLKDFVREFYNLYLQDVVRLSFVTFRKHAVSVFCVFSVALSIFIVSQPYVWNTIYPALYALSLTAFDLLRWTFARGSELTSEVWVSAVEAGGAMKQTTLAAVRTLLRSFADRLGQLADAGGEL